MAALFMPSLPNRRTPFFIVMNSRSGSGQAVETREIMRSVLRSAGQAHEFISIERPQDLPQVAAQAARKAYEQGGFLVAVGGDGTINAVAQAALSRDLALGIVPQGTFNYSSRAHDIPLDTEQATRALLDARLAPMQVGKVNDRIFLVNASVGLYPQALEQREAAEAQFGRKRSVALWSGLRSLLQEHRQLSLEIECDAARELVRTPTLFIGNNPLQLERVGLPESNDVQQHRLAAVIVETHRPAELLWLALRGALGTLGEAGNVRNFAFTRMQVSPWLRYGTRSIKVAIDGEVIRMRPPLGFSVAKQPLWLLVPSATQREAQNAD